MRSLFQNDELGALDVLLQPFLLTYYSELLLMEGSAFDVAYRLAVCLAGIYFNAMAAVGYGLSPLSWPSRLIVAVAVILLFLQRAWLNAAGLALGAAHMAWQWSTNTKPRNKEQLTRLIGISKIQEAALCEKGGNNDFKK